VPGFRPATILGIGLALAIPTAVAGADEPPDAARLARVESLIGTLASPEFEGRSGAGARRAAALIVDTFRDLGLRPLFGDSFEQPIPGQRGEGEVGRNVGAWLEGADPELRREWILVAAHYDHLGVRGGRLFPGADDNASGVAMLLEVARSLGEGAPPRRSVAFVAFDREEDGLWGSRHFVQSPPRPLESIRLLLVADMLGRSLAGVCDEFVFVLGSENAPGLRPSIDRAAEGLPVRLGVVGSDVLLFDRSDYGPFRVRGIPYLFFTTGESPVYHSPEDRPETLDYAKLGASIELVSRLARDASGEAQLPDWSAPPDHALDEAVAIRDVLARLRDHADDLAIKPLQRTWIDLQIRDLTEAIGRGRLTPDERRRMVSGAQLVLYTIL
jgi:hypothetical protein